MDDVAPELNPGWVHRRKNSYSAVRSSQISTAILRNLDVLAGYIAAKELLRLR